MTPPREAHGILAHYFHGEEFSPTQGSLSAEEWEQGLSVYGSRLVGAQEWYEAFQKGRLGDAVVVTLDDGLIEQEIALDVLKRRSLTAFLNVYTGPLLGVANGLERARWVRNHAFQSIEEFYAHWRPYAHAALASAPMPATYLVDRGYLSYDDRVFRYWRNELVSQAECERIMVAMVGHLRLPWAWLTGERLRELRKARHLIGFHSHTHPTRLAALSLEQQVLEYATSRYILGSTVFDEINTMSHPNGSYTEDGLVWLRKHGVVLGWGATMQDSGPLAMPRWSTGYWRDAPPSR